MRKCKIVHLTGSDMFERAEAIIESYSREFDLTHFQVVDNVRLLVLIFQSEKQQ